MTQSYDDLVIGAGIVGVATALHLLMRGRTVALIDRRGPALETSFGNAGIIEASSALPFGFPPLAKIPDILFDRNTAARIRYRDLPRSLPWIFKFYLQSTSKNRLANGRHQWPLVALAIEEHKHLMSGTNAETYWQKEGRVVLYRDEAGFAADAPIRKAAEDFGIPFDVKDRAAFADIEPGLKPHYHKAVHWTSSAHISDPGALVTAYAERFAREGGTFIRADVSKIVPTNDNRWLAETNGGALNAKNIVICTGPWAGDLLKPLGYRFPLGSKRGYHRHFKMREDIKLRYTFLDARYGYVLATMKDSYRLTTGAEFADRDAPPDPVQIERCLPFARDLFPLGEVIDAEAWCGSRPCFPDSLPIIGPASYHAGLWFNFGHGHVGLTIGPSSGRLLAELMTGTPSFCDPSPYRAARFGC